jgi:hypothetical protein
MAILIELNQRHLARDAPHMEITRLIYLVALPSTPNLIAILRSLFAGLPLISAACSSLSAWRIRRRGFPRSYALSEARVAGLAFRDKLRVDFRQRLTRTAG